jgi:hypothetical protein
MIIIGYNNFLLKIVKLIKQINQKKHGSALVMVLVMVVIVSMILTSLLGYITSQVSYSKDRVKRERAFQISEAGVFFYRWYLAHEISGKTAEQIETFWGTTGSGCPLGVCSAYEDDFKDPEGNVIGRYRLEVQKPGGGSTIVTAKSTGWTYKKPSVKRIVQVRFRRPSWSEYTFLSNSFLNFGTQATVYGKVHSNYGIHFNGVAYNTISALPARFHDPNYGGTRLDFGVYTSVNPVDPAAPTYPWASGTVPTRSDVFVGGREFPAPEVSFTGVTADFSNLKAKAQSGNGRYFDSSGMGRKITLKSDGTYDVCTVNSANSNTHAISNFSGVVSGASGSYSATNGTVCTTSSCCSSSACSYIQSSNHSKGKCVTLSNYPIIDGGGIFVEDNAWVEGSVDNKRITIAAADLSGGGNQADIYIGISNSDLRLSAYDCNNMLGLVAQKDVRVLNDCPADFVVDAALLAQTGLVGIVNGMGGKYSLTFNGAIASYLQPYFQSGNSGFADRTYNFNNNLLYCPPPYFPTGTEYFIDLWDEL